MEGDFQSALRDFRSVTRIKSTQGVWIDSITYHTMVGECMYHMGNLRGALEQYTAALQVFVTYPDWLTMVEVPAALQPSARVIRKPPTWGASARVIRVAQIPDQMKSLQGNSRDANMRALQQGGVVSQQQYVLINAKEIVRCTVLAMRRRMEIMGPACQHDPLTDQLVTVLSRRPAPPGSWAQAWISAQLGVAFASNGKRDDAARELNLSLLVGGMDHVVTSTSLLELGKLAFAAKDYAAAGNYFLEATYSAAFLAQDDFTHYEVVAEAFQGALVSYLAAGGKGFFQPLTAGVAWSYRGPRILEASMLLSAAESCAAINDGKQAAGLLERSMQVMRRREGTAGMLGARFQFITAQIGFQAGDVARGSAALANALRFEGAGGSRRLFQISLVDSLFASGALTTRQASDLYPEVLRDPTPHDWAADPLESLAVLTTPQDVVFEHWMLLALDRKENDNALRISEQWRRRRFHSSLPLGGRVLNLRWALEAPNEALSQSVLVQRQDLLARYPAYAQLAGQAGQMTAELRTLSPVTDDPDQQRKQIDLMKQLAQTGDAREAMLLSLAVSREPSEAVFPPRTDVPLVQQKLAPNQRILAFSCTRNATFAFLLGADKYSMWQLEAPARVATNVTKMLREMGHVDRNQAIEADALQSEAWKETAAAILSDLTGKAPASAWGEFEELIVVPDGVLWYVPFEALQVQDGANREPLIDKVRIRYVPTVSLAVPDARPRPRIARTAVVAGTLFPGQDAAVSREMVDELRADDPEVFAVPVKPVPPSAVFSTTLDRLIVLADLANDVGGPFDWAPMDLDRGQAAGSLAQWMALPWGSPDQILLPGFHTLAENGLKKGGTGHEVFLAACGLMATGTRTVLLSRWRDGGETSYDLLREFVRELPHRSPSEAWQRSVRLTRDADLDVAREPRVKSLPNNAPTKAAHPFFWSGYMLLDTGAAPK